MTSLVVMYIWSAITVFYLTLISSFIVATHSSPEIQKRITISGIATRSLCIGTVWPLIMPLLILFIAIRLLTKGGKNGKNRNV